MAAFMDIRLLEKNRPIFADLVLYTIVALTVVLSAWAIDLHRFDLGITISRYIALRPWTYVMYLIAASIMVTLGFIYLKRSKLGIVKTLLYSLAFACIFGCAVCPFNHDWNWLVAEIHDKYAYGLMFAGTASLILMLIKPKNLKQRIFALAAVGYAVYFILCYVIIKWDFFINTIFIWENTFIYIFLAELIVEYTKKKA